MMHGFALLALTRLGARSRLVIALRREIHTRQRDETIAELFAQGAGAHLFNGAFGQFAELEWTKRYANEAGDGEVEMAEHVAYFAVLAFADRKRQPQVRALDAIERGVDRAVMDAVDDNTLAQGIELRLRYRAVRAHPVAAQPAGRRQFQHAGERAVVCQKQQALGVEIEPADADQPRQMPGQAREDGRPALRVVMRRDQAALLMIKKQPRALALRQCLTVDGDAVARRDVERRRRDQLAVDGDPAGGDPFLGLAARGEPRACDRAGNALAVLVGIVFSFIRSWPGLCLASMSFTAVYKEVDARHKPALGRPKAGLDGRDKPGNGNGPMATFMEMALDEARAAGEAGEVPVGCVIVHDGAVLARAGNRTMTDADPTAHAEMVAIRAAAAMLGSERLTACDLYVTLEPCAMCAGAVSFARIRRLYYGAADPKGGAVDSGVKFFASPTCHHRPEVYSGLAEAEASALLKEFFRERR